jgi:hypothetical protein
MDPNSPAGSCRCDCHVDVSECYLCASGTAPTSSLPARTSFGPVPPEVSVDAWIGDAIVEAVDDVLLRDIRNGGEDIQETACIGL